MAAIPPSAYVRRRPAERADPAGRVASEVTVFADETVTFGTAKPVHLLPATRATVGRFTVVDIGLDLACRPATRARPLPASRCGTSAGTGRFPVLATINTPRRRRGGRRLAGVPRGRGARDAGARSAPDRAWSATSGRRRSGGWSTRQPRGGLRARPGPGGSSAAGLIPRRSRPRPRSSGLLPTRRWLGELARRRRRRGAREGGSPPGADPAHPHAGELARLVTRLSGSAVERAEVVADPGSGPAGRRPARRLRSSGAPRRSSSHRLRVGEPVLAQSDAPAWLATAGAGDVLAGILGTLLAAGLPDRARGGDGSVGARPSRRGRQCRRAVACDRGRRVGAHCCRRRFERAWEIITRASRVGPCARVDLDALAANVATCVRWPAVLRCSPSSRPTAGGHGMVQAARAALAGERPGFGVAQLGEALTSGVPGVSAPCSPGCSPLGGPRHAPVRADIDPGVRAWSPWARSPRQRLGPPADRPVHLKLDTGLSCNGLRPWPRPDEVPRALGLPQAEGAVGPCRAFSHPRLRRPAGPRQHRRPALRVRRRAGGDRAGRARPPRCAFTWRTPPRAAHRPADALARPRPGIGHTGSPWPRRPETRAHRDDPHGAVCPAATSPRGPGYRMVITYNAGPDEAGAAHGDGIPRAASGSVR